MSKKMLISITILFLVACGRAVTTEIPIVQPNKTPTVESTNTPISKPTEIISAPTPTTNITPNGTLTIWVDRTRAPILQDLANQVLDLYQFEMIIEEKSEIRDDFQEAVQEDLVPDIIILPHDQAGLLIDGGLLATVDLGEKATDFTPVSLEACTFGGKLYCLPFVTENMGFFYNTDLVGEPPTTWDDVIEVGTQLINIGKTKYILALTGTTYDLYPLLTAFGGYIFGKNDDGSWNPRDLGLDSQGMINAVKWIRDNISIGKIPADTDWTKSHALFEAGEVPFIMSGPWALNRIRKSGVPYRITNFPDDGFPFGSAQGFFISSKSSNKLIAQAFFTEVLATEDVMTKLFEVTQRPSAYIPVLKKTTDADLLALGSAGENATMMPTIPEMNYVWAGWNEGVTFAIQGKQDAESAMVDAAQKVRELIRGEKIGMVNVPGSYQSQVGCDSDWQPDCDATAMTLNADGRYWSGPFTLTAGDYQVKVALDGSWSVNYGSNGVAGGANITFSLPAEGDVSFEYDPETNLLTIIQ